MSYRRLKKGKRYERDEQGRYHYELRFRAGGKQKMRRQWFHNDAEATAYIEK
jgi:hypothetical protein